MCKFAENFTGRIVSFIVRGKLGWRVKCRLFVYSIIDSRRVRNRPGNDGSDECDNPKGIEV